MGKSKKVRVDRKRRQRNRAVKSGIKTAVGELNKLVSNKDAGAAKESLVKAIRILDRAASKGVMHHNTAARRKSRLARKVHGLSKT